MTTKAWPRRQRTAVASVSSVSFREFKDVGGREWRAWDIKPHEIHPATRKPSPIAPLEFDVPAAATRGGELTLTFSAPPGLGSAGRGNQIAEVWLVRK